MKVRNLPYPFLRRQPLKLLNDVLFLQSKPTVGHFIPKFDVQIWRFPGVSIATSVLHSIT